MASNLSPTSSLERSPDASYQVVAGEAILIHLKTGVYYSLNAVATAFWDMLDGHRTIADCAQAIAGLAEDAPPLETITSDLLELAGRLAHERLAVVKR